MADTIPHSCPARIGSPTMGPMEMAMSGTSKAMDHHISRFMPACSFSSLACLASHSCWMDGPVLPSAAPAASAVCVCFGVAPYPMRSTASMMSFASVVSGSNSTIMVLLMRFTFTSCTPASRATAFVTLASQAAQVMPVTSNCSFMRCPPSCPVSYCCPPAGRFPAGCSLT